nr:hypothetical protein [uncultured Oscillibacter sp.]
MKSNHAIELGLTIPLQRHLHLKALPYPQEQNRRFCWDIHVIPLRGRPSLLAVHCHTRYTFVLYNLNRLEWERLPDVFLDGLRLSLSSAGFPAEVMKELCGSELPLFTRTHGRREVAFLNRAWEDVMAADMALDENSQSQPLLEQIINAKPSRCAGTEGLGMAAERLADMLSQI